ncbi:ubiquitin fusion degradation protein [Trypanosoma rangeli]|uniref:Ubiquitin fusion degradation protein n=1 Tax=Trypanosoma rangeli TaxID=5698 RepID=A0A3R7LYH5_TRYRA|nr:ubiquitin fusion degradation protein [Trypanosoma rangeli]RNF05798.1 ubiquitin fusion degradation protein [Trypanosoma rangeli]|eukprot:RNF05798.1 ubiquitin fusion degradation protein [Trypanosoma rangeli]
MYHPIIDGLDVFRKQLAAYPGEFSERGELVDGGGRVLLPSSCLAEISTMNVAYPLQFCIRSRKGVCYAGVLEFNADNGIVIMPLWMFSALLLQPGDTVTLETCVLPPGKLVKLRPQQSSFIQLSDPRKVLEMHLSHYPVLTRGTSIILRYLDREFIIDVTDITNEADRSVEAISTVRADAQATELKVEFERPLDMPLTPPERELPVPEGTNVIGSAEGVEFAPFVLKPPTIVKKETKGGEAEKQEEKDQAKPGFIPFMGGGRRVNDKPVAPVASAGEEQGVGKTPDEKAREARERRFQAFGGVGRSLR